MDDDIDRPVFVVMFLDETKRRYKEGGLVNIIPFWLILIIVVSYALTLLVPDSFWADSSKTFPFYAGVMTLNGLLLALAWSAFAKIFENIFTPKFSTYLKSEGMISRYTYHVSYVHAVQVGAVAIAAAGLFMLISDKIPVWMNRLELVATLAASVYAVTEAVGIVTTMYDLIWYRSVFEADAEQRQNSNVSNIR